MAERELKILEDRDVLGAAAADWFVRVLAENTGRIAVCMTGGSTVDMLYARLAQRDLPWERMHLFWSDERFVPSDDPRNNAGLARRVLIDRVPIPPENVHPMPVDASNNEDGAARYEAELKRFYGSDTLDPARPLFDIVLNGMGDDGHTASLFPGQPALEERERWVIAAEPKKDPYVPRMTLTFPVLESCRASAFLVSGAAKKDMLQKVLSGSDLPAGRLQPLGPLVWFMDADAAPR